MQSPSFTPIATSEYEGGISGLTIEELNINVDKLDSDRDIEDVANQVCKALEQKLARGKTIGGIRVY